MKEYKIFCKSRNIEIECCPPRVQTGNGAVERGKLTMKNLITANLNSGETYQKAVNGKLE